MSSAHTWVVVVIPFEASLRPHPGGNTGTYLSICGGGEGAVVDYGVT